MYMCYVCVCNAEYLKIPQEEAIKNMNNPPPSLCVLPCLPSQQLILFPVLHVFKGKCLVNKYLVNEISRKWIPVNNWYQN